MDAAGNLYIADESEDSIRRVSAADGTISTIAGDPMHAQNGYKGDGRSAVSALLSYPITVRFDGAGNLYIADGGNYLIRRIDTSGVISTIARNTAAAMAANGSGGLPPGCAALTDICGQGGAPLNATLSFVADMAFDKNGNLFFAKSDTNIVREIDLSSTASPIHIVAGTLRMPCSPSGTPPPYGDGGLATSAQLKNDFGIIVDTPGNIAVSDASNNAVRLVTTTDGKIQTIAGQISASGGFGGDNGPATAALLNAPQGLALDMAGTLLASNYTFVPVNGTLNVTQSLP